MLRYLDKDPSYECLYKFCECLREFNEKSDENLLEWFSVVIIDFGFAEIISSDIITPDNSIKGFVFICIFSFFLYFLSLLYIF
jgi:hypothetical protein